MPRERNRIQLSSAARQRSPSPRTAASEKRSSLQDLIARCRPGWSLPREFFCEETIYRADLERIWRQGWLFAGHSCEIPQPGDYFTLDVDTDPLVVIRGDDGIVRGLHNVCRHRGSLVCTDATGHATR